MIGLVKRNEHATVSVVVVGSGFRKFREITAALTAENSRPRVDGDIVIIALNDDLIWPVSLAIPMPVVMVVVMVVVSRTGRAAANIVILLSRCHLISYQRSPKVVVIPGRVG